MAKEKHTNASFLYAVFKGNLPRVKKFISLGVDVGCSTEGDQHTALQLSLDSNSMVVVKTVLAAVVATGVDINAKNRIGQTALTIAKSKGYDNVVKLLIEAGADDTYVNTTVDDRFEMTLTSETRVHSNKY